MTDLKVTIDDKAVSLALRTAVKAVGKPKPLMQSVARIIKTRIQLAFRGERDPYGVPWKPLKSRQGQILTDTGRLSRSWNTRVTDTSAEVGTNVRYAAYHQFGTKHVPARPFLPTKGWPPKWRSAILTAANNYVKKAI